jgi:hypothetical protein
MWCIGEITGEYLARLENILGLYHLPYNRKRAVICIDELPFQFLGDKVEPTEMKSGAVKKVDYEYQRCGTAAVFVAFEPLTGRRLVRVYRQRTKADYCRFQLEVALEWAAAEVIVLVQDNLNTHNASSFYENLPSEEAYWLMKRFEFHYTPKKGSWLNMAELELPGLSRQCLARRIPDIETLSRELECIVKERNELAVKVKWQFTVENARQKLNRHYENVISKD